MNKFYKTVPLKFFWIFILLFAACEKPAEQAKITIAISKEKKAGNSENYHNWLLRYNRNVDYKILYGLPVDSAVKVAATCDGLLLTGGNDVFPGYYGKIDDTARCGTFDRYRDSLEFALIDQAIKNRQPLFGICRGEQIINIAMGGTLYIDIPTDFSTLVVHRQEDWQHCRHSVWIEPGTLMSVITQVSTDTVTSNHHQGIEQLGEGLLVSARSADSLPEAVEWAGTSAKGFLMAVQWHPERMTMNSPLSKQPAVKFLNEAEKYHKVLNPE